MFRSDSKEITITGVRLKKYHLDAPREYVREVERLIADHANLAQGGEFYGAAAYGK